MRLLHRNIAIENKNQNIMVQTNIYGLTPTLSFCDDKNLNRILFPMEQRLGETFFILELNFIVSDKSVLMLKPLSAYEIDD